MTQPTTSVEDAALLLFSELRGRFTNLIRSAGRDSGVDVFNDQIIVEWRGEVCPDIPSTWCGYPVRAKRYLQQG